MSAPTTSYERRARRLPWGIEIQLWRLVETRTYPNEAERLPLSSIFSDGDGPGAQPTARTDDEDTLEHLDDETTLEDVEFEYAEPEGNATPKERP